MPRAPHLLTMTLVALAMSTACREPSWQSAEPRTSVGQGAIYETEIRTPATLDGLPTGDVDHLGRPVVIACATCHDGRDDEMVADDGSLEHFHVGMKVRHASLPCASCHHEQRRDMLRLADGSAVAMDDAMTLCAQCHGSQHRDYQQGSHGGMAGHWDLTRGPRVRNHCIMCHDPHEPAFPGLSPLPAPRDRGLRRPNPEH